MSLQQAHPRTGRTLLDRLPMAMTVSRLWMYSHRASSMTRALFIDGMAGKSKVSRLLTVGNRAARIRRSTMRWRRSMSLQFREPEQVLGMIHILGGAQGSHLPVLLEEAGQLQFFQVMFQEQRRPVAHAALSVSRLM